MKYTQESGEGLKIEKNGKSAFPEKNKDKNGHAIALVDAIKMTKNTCTPKTLLTHINSHHICINYQVWSHSTHKRPRNCQKTVFFLVFGCQNTILAMFWHPIWPQKNTKSTFLPKAPLTYLHTPQLWTKYQLWSHSAHKRPRYNQKTSFSHSGRVLEMLKMGTFWSTFDTKNRYLDFADAKTLLTTITWH